MENLTVGKLAKEVGINIETIRYYENIKLMPIPKRMESGYRVYSEMDLDRLKFVKKSQQFRFTLKEIKMNNTKIEVQYFTGCPNSEEVLNMVRKFVAESELQIDFDEILVETQADAEKYKFRGSPTILINGKDVEGVEENKTPSLACRYYKDGLPTEEDILKMITTNTSN
ncbi:MAG: MerR family transcriptional regulator [Melioribacteraceae bacterium]|nr:MerR family transcriptional regulator [Melioribacteraceae bacterium]